MPRHTLMLATIPIRFSPIADAPSLGGSAILDPVRHEHDDGQADVPAVRVWWLVLCAVSCLIGAYGLVLAKVFENNWTGLFMALGAFTTAVLGGVAGVIRVAVPLFKIYMKNQQLELVSRFKELEMKLKQMESDHSKKIYELEATHSKQIHELEAKYSDMSGKYDTLRIEYDAYRLKTTADLDEKDKQIQTLRGMVNDMEASRKADSAMAVAVVVPMSSPAPVPPASATHPTTSTGDAGV